MYGSALRSRRSVLPVVTGLLLAISALLPLTHSTVSSAVRDFGAAVNGDLRAAPAGSVALLGGIVLAAALGLARLLRGVIGRRPTGGAVRLLLHLWPVGVLTVIYPAASRRMAGHDVGGVDLTTFLLAAALLVPWIIQGVCMPFYRVLGALAVTGDQDAVRRRFCAIWLTTSIQAWPVLLIFTLPLGLVLHWSPAALGAHTLLVALNLAFAQALVLANLRHSRLGWALAWTGYALPVLVFPAAWYLPPLLGVLTQLIPLRRHLLARPVWLPTRDVAMDVGRGLLLGSVLWADKVFYYFSSAGDFPVSTVFLALLPAVLAYNYYFICIAPKFDESVHRLRSALESAPMTALTAYSRELAERVSASIRQTAFIGAVFVLIASWALGATEPHLTGLIASVSLASWLFMMTTVLCYKLDYIGARLPAQVFSAAHLVMCAAVFALMPPGPSAYFTLAAAELIVFASVLPVCLRVWRTPEYALFWRHALAW